MQTQLNKVITALTEFYGRETYLFANDLGERTLTHRLAVHLEKQFAGWEAGRLSDAGLGLNGDEAAATETPPMRTAVARKLAATAVLLMAGLAGEQSSAQTPAAAPAVEAAYQAILANAKVVKTLEDIKADDDTALAEQKRITEIPAPPYKEKIRAEYFLKRMQELGFKEASIDSEGNVIALREGSGGGRPKLVVSAHLDPVFPEGTDVTVKEKDGVILAPGIGDESRGLAALLSLIKSINANGIATVGDVMFVGSVGREELGKLRGANAVLR